MDAHLDEDGVDEAVERAKNKVNGVVEPIIRIVVLGGAFVGGAFAAWKAIESAIDEATKKTRRGKR